MEISFCDKILSMEKFGEWLLTELKKNKMTQSELARLAGLGSGTISNIMSGEKKVGADTATAIAHVLRIHPRKVFEKAGLLPPSAEDPWVADMEYKINLLDDTGRQLAEKFLNSLLEIQDNKDPQQSQVKPALNK